MLCNKVLVSTGIKLLNKVDAPHLEDSRDFCCGTSPIRHMMQDTKTEYGVENTILERESKDISHIQ